MIQMIDIVKQKEPRLLKRHRTSNPNANYDNGPADMKREIQEALVREQFGLCCYCMQKIGLDSVRIEHKLSQSKHPDLSLKYENMAGACNCSEGLPKEKQHCDIYKDGEDFTYDLSSIQDIIQYGPQGIIKSRDPELNRQINEVLNLNTPELMNLRKGIYDAVRQFFRKYSGNKGIIQHRIARLNHPSNGLKDAFCGVTIFFLEKRLRHCN